MAVKRKTPPGQISIFSSPETDNIDTDAAWLIDYVLNNKRDEDIPQYPDWSI